MAQAPRSLLDSLSEALAALSDAGRRMMEAALPRLADAYTDGSGLVPAENVASLRDAAVELMEQVCAELSDLAAAEAAESYAEQRRLARADGAYAASADPRRVPQATAEAVRAFAKTVADTGETGRFAQQLAGRVDYEVRRAANECAALNAEADPAAEGYYRVPSGKETCGYCLMLAAFGPQEGNADKARHVHANCDCRVVPAYAGQGVEGYDRDGMYDRYLKCLDALGGRDGIRAEWDALPEGERKARIARRGGRSAAFDAYVGKRVSEEIETRDPEWFVTGKAPRAERENGAKPSEKERDTAGRLARHGFKSRFRKTRDKEMKKTSDVFLIGSRSSVAWDIKGPSGNGTQTVYHQFEEAAGQARRVVIDFADAGERFDDKKRIEEQVRRFLRYHYRVETGVDAGREWRFEEALVVFKDGEVKRIVR